MPAGNPYGSSVSKMGTKLTPEAQRYFGTNRSGFDLLYHHNDHAVAEIADLLNGFLCRYHGTYSTLPTAGAGFAPPTGGISIKFGTLFTDRISSRLTDSNAV